jgi:hypothetical protein
LLRRMGLRECSVVTCPTSTRHGSLAHIQYRPQQRSPGITTEPGGTKRFEHSLHRGPNGYLWEIVPFGGCLTDLPVGESVGGPLTLCRAEAAIACRASIDRPARSETGGARGVPGGAPFRSEIRPVVSRSQILGQAPRRGMKRDRIRCFAAAHVVRWLPGSRLSVSRRRGLAGPEICGGGRCILSVHRLRPERFVRSPPVDSQLSLGIVAPADMCCWVRFRIRWRR